MRRFFRSKMFGAAAGAMMAAAATLLGASSAQAEVRAGSWERLSSSEFAALLRVEAQTGIKICKIENADGSWSSNHMSCTGVLRNGMIDPNEGVMTREAQNPLLWFVYPSFPTDIDRTIARAVDAERQVTPQPTDQRVAAARKPVQRAGAVDTPAPVVAAVTPARPALSAAARTRLTQALAGLGDRPNAEGKFKRGGDAYELRQTADGTGVFAFRYVPQTNRYVVAFNASLRDDGRVKLTTGSNLRQVDAGTLVAYNTPVAPATVEVAQVVPQITPEARVVTPVQANPFVVRNSTLDDLMRPTLIGDAAGAFTRVQGFDSRAVLAQAQVFVPAEQTPAAVARAAEATVLASAVVKPLSDVPPAGTADSHFALAAAAPELPAFVIMDENVQRVVAGSALPKNFVRVRTTKDDRIIDIAKDWRNAAGDIKAFEITGKPNRERHTVFDLAQAPVLRSALRMVAA